MQDLGLQYVPWSLYSLEPVFSMFLPSYLIKLVDTNFLRDQKKFNSELVSVKYSDYSFSSTNNIENEHV